MHLEVAGWRLKNHWLPPHPPLRGETLRRELRVARIISRGTCRQEVKNPLIKLLPCAIEAHKEPPTSPPSAGKAASVLHKSCTATSSAREAQRQQSLIVPRARYLRVEAAAHARRVLLSLSVVCVYLLPYECYLRLSPALRAVRTSARGCRDFPVDEHR